MPPILTYTGRAYIESWHQTGEGQRANLRVENEIKGGNWVFASPPRYSDEACDTVLEVAPEDGGPIMEIDLLDYIEWAQGKDQELRETHEEFAQREVPFDTDRVRSSIVRANSRLGLICDEAVALKRGVRDGVSGGGLLDSGTEIKRVAGEVRNDVRELAHLIGVEY